MVRYVELINLHRFTPPAPGGLDMGIQPVEFLANVALGRKQGHLVQQTLLRQCVGDQIGEALLQALAQALGLQGPERASLGLAHLKELRRRGLKIRRTVLDG